MPKIKKILIITYYWPPCGGAGVQRWLKFTRYMPENGWKPFVLTVDPAFAQYPAIDSSLEKDIHPDTIVHKTKAVNYFKLGGGSSRSVVSGAGFATGRKSIFSKIARFTRGNLFIPDPRKGWNNYAIQRAVEIIKKEDISYVVTTSPPHSTQLIGLALKKRLPGIKWICDLRDPWTDIYYYREFYGTPPARAYDKKLERRVLREADKIITVGNSLASLFMDKDASVKKKISVITNGYDEEDFVNKEKEPPEHFTITYIGTLSEKYPIESILEPLNNLQKKGIDFQFKFIGVCPEQVKKMIISELPDDTTNFYPYEKHDEALQTMINSSVLLLIIPEHKHEKLIITGKLFEYIRSYVPILLIGPADGDAAQILEETGSGKSFNKQDSHRITNYLLAINKTGLTPRKNNKYSRKYLTKELINFLEQI
ncbi:MAG: glycosyltransferase family 4 protein [Bacteroidales bacterium]|nr:glycosyltransferase family 4 protein [Bacteroidales bacterium]